MGKYGLCALWMTAYLTLIIALPVLERAPSDGKINPFFGLKSVFAEIEATGNICRQCGDKGRQ